MIAVVFVAFVVVACLPLCAPGQTWPGARRVRELWARRHP